MKYILLVMPILLFLLLSCSDSKRDVPKSHSSRIRSVRVSGITLLTRTDDGTFYNPRFVPDGSKIMFTTSGYNGLAYYDLESKKIVDLNSMPGAGANFVVSQNNSFVYFTSDTVKNRRRYCYLYQQDILTHEVIKLSETLFRSISALTEIENGRLAFFDNNDAKTFDIRDKKLSTDLLLENIYKIEEDEIIATGKDGRKIYSPFPNQNLIWLESIPKSKDLLVFVVGRGLYRFRPETDTSELLGDFRAGRCSPDGQLVAYMLDENDGHRTTRSDIYVVILDNLESFVITNTKNEHEMYPQWSPDGQKIVFQDAAGQIYLAKLVLN